MPIPKRKRRYKPPQKSGKPNNINAMTDEVLLSNSLK